MAYADQRLPDLVSLEQGGDQARPAVRLLWELKARHQTHVRLVDEARRLFEAGLEAVTLVDEEDRRADVTRLEKRFREVNI